MEASYWPKRVSLAVIYCREIAEVSIKPDGDGERPSVSLSEYEKCYPVLTETAVTVGAALLCSQSLPVFLLLLGLLNGSLQQRSLPSSMTTKEKSTVCPRPF